MKRLFFLNRYFHPDHSATSQLLSDLAFHLAASGRQVNVITSQQRYDDPGSRLPAKEIVNGSGRIEARTGLRMMPTFPRSSLSFRTAGFPQYGWKAGISGETFPARHSA
jgi:hypothetical protein